jgi:hypothetical protein
VTMKEALERWEYVLRARVGASTNRTKVEYRQKANSKVK